MALELATPDEFPAFPYSPPYSIQLDVMRHLYAAIENRKVTIVESPTGTGKTLSLLCASLTWLTDEKDRARRGELDAKAGVMESGPAWVVEQTRERHRRELEAKEQEYEERLSNARRKEKEMRKSKARVVKKPRLSEIVGHDEENEDIFLPDSDIQEDEDDNLSPAVRALMARMNQGRSNDSLNSDEPTCTKIFYASRTHSQLAQVLPELSRLKIRLSSHKDLPQEGVVQTSKKRKAQDDSSDAEGDIYHSRAVSLGSRRHLCINDVLRSRVSDIDEGCRELLGEKEDKRCPYLPSAEEEFRMNDFRDQILATPKDIEDLADAGRRSNICPYFGSRRAIPQAELVTLPYNLLLQKSSREALGIDLTNQVVVIDEAHNLISTLLSLSTNRVSFATLDLSLQQVSVYVSKFRNRLSATNILHLKRLTAFLEALKRYMLEWKQQWKTNSQKVEILSATELIERLGRRIKDINMLSIEQYLRKSKIARKIARYADKQAEKGSDPAKASPIRRGAVPPLHAIENLMLSLAGASEDGRVSLSLVGKKDQEEIEIKYQLLNPAPHFKEVLDEARSVILAGGTMSPISDVVNQILSHVPPERITSFSCGHIIPSSHLLTVAVTKGPRGGELVYKAGRQSEPTVIAELAQILLNFTHTVPSGMIVFFPSYNFLNTAKSAWVTGGMLEKLQTKKKVFFEPEDSALVESTLQGYAAAVQTSQQPGEKNKGALLFAVIGAKLSEGLNFKDDLARAVVIVGLPFANLASPELRERMKYVKRLEDKHGVGRSSGMKDAAAELYENMCMNAVNQSIGRAIRHQNDWAALILLDQRYSTSSIRNKLPKWIGNDLKIAQSFGQVVKEMGTFYRSKQSCNSESHCT